jgi:beta-glucosidase
MCLAPFGALLRDAGVWEVTAACNRVNGTTMTELPLLDEVLRGGSVGPAATGPAPG